MKLSSIDLSRMTASISYSDPDGCEFREEEPVRIEICPNCVGAGLLYEYNSDHGGLPHWCEGCDGCGRVAQVDRDRCDPDVFFGYEDYLTRMANLDAEIRRERRLGL